MLTLRPATSSRESEENRGIARIEQESRIGVEVESGSTDPVE